MEKRTGSNGLRWTVVIVGILYWQATAALAAPAWYTAGTGGFNPNLPDFYQHQDFVANGINGGSANDWEPNGGWCYQVAYSDAFYDLATQGYTGLYTNKGVDPTPAGPGWYTAMYGPAPAAGKSVTNANVDVSNIYLVNQNLGGVQQYLDKYVNNQTPVTRMVNPLPSLVSLNWNVDPSTGNVYYNLFGLQLKTNMSIFNFTNTAIDKLNSEVLLNMRQGTAPVVPMTGNNQTLWWGNPNPAKANGGNFHEVAVAGLDVKGSTLFVADPDTNPSNPVAATGSDAAHGGWPSLSAGFPGIQPTGVGGSYGLMTPSNAPLPVSAGVIGNVASYNQNYTDFSFAKNVITSAASPAYNNTIVNSVATISPSFVKAAMGAAAGPGKEETAVTVNLPSTADGAVDQIIVEPSSQALDPSSNPGFDSLSDPSEPSSIWQETEDTSDPFGNSLSDDAIDYDLTGGNPLEPGESATIDLGTTADFAAEGYDVLLHFQGDPADEWLPQEVAGSLYDPEDFASTQLENLPEPTSLLVLAIGAAGLGMRRKRRTH